MAAEKLNNEANIADQHRHLQGEGAALAFQPQPMDVDVRVDSHQAISSPVVATLEMGDNHFVIIDQGEQAGETNRDRYAVLNAILKTDNEKKVFYLPTAAVGTLGSENNRIELGRTELQQRGFTHIDSTMSRKHAAIELHTDGFVVRDHGGKNGTDINFSGPEIPTDDITVPREELDRLRGTLLPDSNAVNREQVDAAPVSSNYDETPKVAEQNSDAVLDESWHAEAVHEHEQAVGEAAEDIGEVALGEVIEPKPDMPEQAVPEEVEQEEPATADQPTELAEVVETPPELEVSEAPEFIKPSTKDIFQSSESIEKTLHDPQVDSAIKAELQGLLSQWHELKNADIVTQAWNQDIQPKLNQLSETAPALLKVVEDAEMIREQLQIGLIQVRDVLGSRGGINEVGDALRYVQIGNKLMDLEGATRALSSNENLSTAMTQLAAAAEDADIQIRKARNNDVLSDEDSEAFRERFADGIQAGVPINTLRGELDRDLSERRTPAWRQQRETIDTIVAATRRATNMADLNRTFLRFSQDIEMLTESAQRGSFNEADYDSAARGPAMIAIAEELDYIRSMLTRARITTEELQR